jgi:hypothetical protein
VYNLTQCKTPDWPPLCPYQLKELIPCLKWRCEGLPPAPSPEPSPEPGPIAGGIDAGGIVAIIFVIFALLAMVGVAVYLKQVNLNIKYF